MVWRVFPNLKTLTPSVTPTPLSPTNPSPQHSPCPPSSTCRFDELPLIQLSKPYPPKRLHPPTSHTYTYTVWSSPLVLASLSPNWLLPKPTAHRSFESNSPDICQQYIFFFIFFLINCLLSIIYPVLAHTLFLSSNQENIDLFWMRFLVLAATDVPPIPQSPTRQPLSSDRLPAEDFQVWSRMRDLAHERTTSLSTSPDRNRGANQITSPDQGNAASAMAAQNVTGFKKIF